MNWPALLFAMLINRDRLATKARFRRTAQGIDAPSTTRTQRKTLRRCQPLRKSERLFIGHVSLRPPCAVDPDWLLDSNSNSAYTIVRWKVSAPHCVS